MTDRQFVGNLMTHIVLLIEDNSNNALLVKRILTAQSVKVLHAWTGESGLQMAVENQPDLILLDLGLPDIDGQTVATLIKRMPKLADVPIIAVTAWPVETAQEMVKAYGCDAYIAKPIDPKEFWAVVQTYLTKDDT